MNKLLCSARFLPIALFGLLVGLLSAGCGGGGGGGVRPGGGQAGAGQDPPVAAEPSNDPVQGRGRVIIRTPQDGVDFLSAAKVQAFNDAGERISSAITAADGTYQLLLASNENNTIRVAARGYTYAPDEVVVRPVGATEIPLIVATKIRFEIPGASRVPDAPLEVPQMQGEATVSGSIAEVRVEGNASRIVEGPLRNHEIAIMDANTSRVLATTRTDRNNRFSYTGPVGQTILIRPKGANNVRWRNIPVRHVMAQAPAASLQLLYEVPGGQPAAPAAAEQIRVEVSVLRDPSSVPRGPLQGVPGLQVDFVNVTAGGIATRTQTNNDGRAGVNSREGDQWRIQVASSGYRSDPASVTTRAERNTPRVPRIYVTPLNQRGTQQLQSIPSSTPPPRSPARLPFLERRPASGGN